MANCWIVCVCVSVSVCLCLCLCDLKLEASASFFILLEPSYIQNDKSQFWLLTCSPHILIVAGKGNCLSGLISKKQSSHAHVKLHLENWFHVHIYLHITQIKMAILSLFSLHLFPLCNSGALLPHWELGTFCVCAVIPSMQTLHQIAQNNHF